MEAITRQTLTFLTLLKVCCCVVFYVYKFVAIVFIGSMDRIFELRMYYMVVAGYQDKRRYLRRYTNCGHHLRDYRYKHRSRGSNDISNYAHSSLRNIIEICFCLLKARFLIPKEWSHTLTDQVLIVVTATTFHNFFKQEAWKDRLFEKYYTKR